MVMGGYGRATRPAFLPDGPAGLDRIPPDFNGRLLEDGWDRFAEVTDNSKRRAPVMVWVCDMSPPLFLCGADPAVAHTVRSCAQCALSMRTPYASANAVRKCERCARSSAMVEA